MANLDNLAGVYEYTPPFLTLDNFKLELVKYTKIKFKSKLGIYAYCPGKKSQFLSSLFLMKPRPYQPVTTVIFTFDYCGINYWLLIDSTKPGILEILKKSPKKAKFEQISILGI
jgi:hypothetical protein